MAYGARVPKELYNEIRYLLDNTRIGKMFNANISEFTRSAVRIQIIAYYFREKYVKLEPIYFEIQNHPNAIKLQAVVIDEIEKLFIDMNEIRVRYNNSKNKFIKYALYYHLVYWNDVLETLKINKSS